MSLWTVEDWMIHYDIEGQLGDPTDRYIDDGWQVNPFPPFLRPKVPFTVKNTQGDQWVMVDGVKNEVQDWSSRKHLGHTFFFDIDEVLPVAEVVLALIELVYSEDISHLVLTQTKAGFHVWSTEIKENKVGWFRLFMNLKNLYKSDYEFQSNWILRTGRKGVARAPYMSAFICNEDVSDRPFSTSHLFILFAHADLDPKSVDWVLDTQKKVESYLEILQYRSWNL